MSFCAASCNCCRQDMMRTGLPGLIEHFFAYAGSAAIGITGYGPGRAGTSKIGSSAVFDVCRHPGVSPAFLTSRHPSILDLAASALRGRRVVASQFPSFGFAHLIDRDKQLKTRSFACVRAPRGPSAMGRIAPSRDLKYLTDVNDAFERGDKHLT